MGEGLRWPSPCLFRAGKGKDRVRARRGEPPGLTDSGFFIRVIGVSNGLLRVDTRVVPLPFFSVWYSWNSVVRCLMLLWSRLSLSIADSSHMLRGSSEI